MKTILKIIMILLAAIVAGGFFLAVNNTTASGPGGQPPARSNSAGQPPAHPEGDREGGASLGGGLLQVLGTLAKLAGIVVVVLLIEKTIQATRQRKLQAS